MKRRKKLWIMGGVLGLVLVLTLSVAMIDHKMEKIQESGEEILQIPVDSVTALSWDYNGETLSFQKDTDWHYDGDEKFPVSTKTLESMLEIFDGMSAAFRIEDVEDYDQYGLTEPFCTIGLTAGDQDYEIRLGAYSKMDQQRYVDIGDGNVYLLFHDPMEEFDRDIRSVIANDRAPFLEEADQLTFTGAENYTILRNPEGGKSLREEDQYFAQVNGQLLPLNTTTVENYISDMTLVDLVNYKTYTAGEEDLSKYGLDQPELTIQVDYTKEVDGEPEQQTYVLHVSRDPEALKAAEATENTDKAEAIPAYARVDQSEIVYEIQPADYDRIAACGYDDLRHREIFPAHTEDITGLTVTLDGQQYAFDSTLDEKEEKRTFTFGGQEADISEILTAIQSLHAEDFTEEAPTGRLEVRLEAALEAGTGTTVELYRLDGGQCLAKVDGKTVAKLPRTQVVDLMEKIHSIVLNPVEVPTETIEK